MNFPKVQAKSPNRNNLEITAPTMKESKKLPTQVREAMRGPRSLYSTMSEAKQGTKRVMTMSITVICMSEKLPCATAAYISAAPKSFFIIANINKSVARPGSWRSPEVMGEHHWCIF